MITTLEDVENCLYALGEIGDFFHDQDDPPPDLDQVDRHDRAAEWLQQYRAELLEAQTSLEKQLDAQNQLIQAKNDEIRNIKAQLKAEKAKTKRIQNALKGIET